jgi:hypothetical protein
VVHTFHGIDGLFQHLKEMPMDDHREFKHVHDIDIE